MPIYEYQCNSCHHQFDVLQKFSDEPIKTCPECAKDEVVRLVSAAGFQLKGTGWYVTDFKDKGKKPETKSAEKSTSTETTKSSSEAKTTETKSSSKSKGDSD